MGVKLSKLMMRQYKDGVYRMSRVTVAKHVAQLEVKNAALRAELMSLKGAYYSANNKGWQLEFDNAALKRENEELKAELREERKRLLLELYNNSAISQFQFDIAMKELELLTTEEPTP